MDGRYAVLFILTLGVIAATAGVLTWFFRRLNKIQEEVWGPEETRRRREKKLHQRLTEAIRGKG